MTPNSDWTSTSLDLNRVFYKLKTETENEFIQYLELKNATTHIDELNVDLSKLPLLKQEIENLRKEVDDGQKFVVLDSLGNTSPIVTECMQWVVSKILGETIAQNEEGRHLIHIYDRDPTKRIKDGARYHQTHESGAIHTDNVNIPENYQYLLVGCAAPAKIGGENIIVSGRAVYDYLNANAREELNILKADFIFEYRGISRELYNAPIITFNEKGEPLFRHLRTYMESAHNRAEKPLTSDQIRALDALDATLSMSQFQLIYRLKPGQILIANDSQILHDRRCFVDDKNTTTLDELKAGTNKHPMLKRTLLRTWVRKV
jgi:alpha-ketoglutarate-dependent taurine dioxygenase